MCWFGLLAGGLPEGPTRFQPRQESETIQDYDAAFVFYQKAAKANPYNSSYKIKLNRVRFEASELHVKHGVELRNKVTCRARQRIPAGAGDRSFEPGGDQELSQDGRNDRGEKPRGRCGG